MAIFGSFASSTLAMIAQSHAFNNISTNIANINTGGYKATDTRFATVLSRTFTSGQGSSTLSGGTPSLDSGLGGVRATDLNRITQQGNIISSARTLDVAINGSGFFALNTAVDSSGDQRFTRDGSFDISTGAEFSVAGIPLSNGTATTVTSNEGFLVDKNGFFVQGIKVNSNGTFTDNGTLESIRLDQFAFVQDFVPTTGAELVLNIPAGQEITRKQVDQFSVAGTLTPGVVPSVTVNGTTVSVPAITATDTFTSVRDALVAAINGNTTIAGAVTATASTNNGLDFNITSNQTSIGFSSFASTNIVAGSGFQFTSSTIQSADLPENSFAISTIDSAGAKQSVRLDFAKVSNNTWEVRSSTSRTPVAQVDTLTLVGDLEGPVPGPADAYSVTINGSTSSISVQTGDTSIDTVRSRLITAINNDVNVNQAVVATASATTGAITLTSLTPGTGFTTVGNAGDPGTDQVDTITLGGAVGDIGDIYSVTIDGKVFSVTTVGTEADLNAIANQIIGKINADPATLLKVTPGTAAGGIFTLTAATTGTPFAATANITNAALGATVNTIGLVNTAVNDTVDTATVAATTANVSNEEISAPTTITFSGNGTLQTPTTLSLPLTFEGGATSTVALDISGLTQFEGDLTPVSFEFGGFAKSEVTSIAFNSEGVITGKFADGTTRPLFKVPLATFTNADGLARNNGNTFSVTADSGAARLVNAGGDGVALILPNAHELSNVDLADEFTKIIVTQKAYNSAATVFRTADEILQTARDLKR